MGHAMWKLIEIIFYIFNEPSSLIMLPFEDDDVVGEGDPRVNQLPADLQRLIRRRARRYLQYEPMFWLGVILFVVYVVIDIAWFIETPWLGVVGLLGFLLIYRFCYVPAHWSAIDRFLHDQSESGRMKYCLKCEYDLRGSDNDLCPDCGTATRIVRRRFATRKWRMRR